MRTIPHPWTLETVCRRESRINPKPQYQRTAVWRPHQKQLLIDSIFRGYDIPKFYLASSTDTGYEHEVVDGQQRLRAIWEFRKDEFELGEASSDLPLGDLVGKKFSDLESDVQDVFALFQISVMVVENATDLEIRDLFSRLQEGVSLSPAEKRNAVPGNMRDFVADLGENHRVFPLTKLSPNRFGFHNLAAHVVALELRGGPADIKAADLYQIYQDNQGFNQAGTVAANVRKTLNYMARVLSQSPPEMRIKWGFVDLYWLISSLDKDYDLAGREDDFLAFFVAFEQERLQVDDPADLIETGDPWDRDLYDYIEAFTTGAGTRQNLEVRHDVYRRRFLRDFPNLVPQDPRRAFSNEERIIIWRRAGSACEDCGQDVTLEEMEAHHTVPHSNGGKTTIDNAECLCTTCHDDRHR